jgi:HEAT repeat protein
MIGFSRKVFQSIFLPTVSPMNRRRFVSTTVLTVAAVVISACSGKKQKRGGGLDRLPAGAPAAKRPKGPQTMGNLLVDAYIADLASPQIDKRLRAARELGNMGSAAKKALPAIEKMARDTNPQVSTAAKEALAAIRTK